MHSFVMDKSCFYRGFLARKLLQAPTVENANAEYWVIDYKGEVQGGCGFYLAKGLPDKCVEIVKYPDFVTFHHPKSMILSNDTLCVKIRIGYVSFKSIPLAVPFRLRCVTIILYIYSHFAHINVIWLSIFGG